MCGASGHGRAIGEERDRLATLRGLERRRIAEEVPPIGKLSCTADVVAVDEAVDHVPRGAALERHDVVDLPAFQQLTDTFTPRQVPSMGQGQAMTDVEIAVTPLEVLSQAVLRIQHAIE